MEDTRVNATRFAVQTMLDGKPVNTYQLQDALNLMELFSWPDGTQWKQRIPILPPKPPRFIGEADNLNFPAEMAAWNANKYVVTAEYVQAIRYDYPTVRFVLMVSADGITWRKGNQEQFNLKLMGFVKATILWADIYKIMKQMLGIK